MSGTMSADYWNSWRGQVKAQILEIEDPDLLANLQLAIDSLSHENIRCADRRNQSSVINHSQDSRSLDAARSLCVWLNSVLGMSRVSIERCCDYTNGFIRKYNLKYLF